MSVFAEQWYDPLTQDQLAERYETKPELMLLKAVLARAIRDAIGESWLVTPDDRVQARKWIYSNAIYSFSFFWVCEHLDLDPDFIRGVIPNTNYPFRDVSVSGMDKICITAC